MLTCMCNDRMAIRLQLIAMASAKVSDSKEALGMAKEYEAFVVGECDGSNAAASPTGSVLDGDELQAEQARVLGRHIRRRWKEILVAARRYGLDKEQIRGAVKAGWLGADDASRKQIAAKLGFDWEGAAEFFATVAPIIIEMMAACGI